MMNHHTRAALLIISAAFVFLTGCASKQIDYQRIPYRELPDGKTLHMDWFFPEEATQSTPSPLNQSPLIVLFHGGGWINGSSEDFHPIARMMRDKGFTTTCVEYRTRLNGNGSIPDAIDDAITALDWIKTHDRDYNFSADQMIISGGSAGGFIALSTAIFSDNTSIKPDALILLSPPTETRWKEGWPKKFRNPVTKLYYDFSIRGDGEILSLVDNLEVQLPPTIIFHGAKDMTVPLVQSQNFVDKARSLNSKIELRILQEEGHGYVKGRTSELTQGVYLEGLDWALAQLKETE